jgi:hypothetical protein
MKLALGSKGVNKDQPPWELSPEYWSDSLNFRFRIGKSTRMGGIASVIASPAITPYYLDAYSSGATRYVFYAGLTKAYVHDGSTETEITRTSNAAIQTVTVATRVRATAVVTLTTGANHGLATGDIITTTGFASPGSFNKVNATITVTGVTTFTYSCGNVGSGDNGAASTIGTYAIVYQAGAAVNNFTPTADQKWTGGNFNGVVFVNNPVDGLYYWDQTVTGKLHTFPDSTVTIQDAVRHFKNWIFLLAPTTSSVKYRHRVQWSQAADPGSVPTSFTASATNDAGFLDLVSDGECVDAKVWGDAFFVYKRDCRYALRWVGGQYVFDEQLVSGNHKDDGCLAIGCIANTPKGQVFLTDGHDVRIHTGGESQSIAVGRVLDWLRSSIDTTYRKRSFLLVNPPYNELWVCFPETAQTMCSKALVWNWEDDTWGIRSLTNITAGNSGEYPATIANDARLLVANSTPKIGLVDSGNTDFGVTLTSTLERTGLTFDDATVMKMLTRSMPLWDASTNFTASVYHGSAKTQDGSYTWSSAITYTHNTTDWCNATSEFGRYLGWKCSLTSSDTPSLVTLELGDYVKGGGRF